MDFIVIRREGCYNSSNYKGACSLFFLWQQTPQRYTLPMLPGGAQKMMRNCTRYGG